LFSPRLPQSIPIEPQVLLRAEVELSLKTRYAAASDRGRARKNNEDAFLADLDLGLFAAADGMEGMRLERSPPDLTLTFSQQSLNHKSNRKPAYLDPTVPGFLTSMILRSMTFVPVGPVIKRSPIFWKKV
jgi:hypothetical protein